MKHSILVILTFFTAVFAFGKCASSGIYVISGHALNKNGLIILEFYGSSQSLVKDLNKKYPIFLKSSKGNVKLSVIETLQGEQGLTQIVLKPISDLKVQQGYSLLVDNLPKNESKPERYNHSTQEWESPTFKVRGTEDHDIPTFDRLPTEENKTFAAYGCGPEVWVYFKIAEKDKSELFVRASVTNKATGKATTCILKIESGLVKIGHAMCYGAFSLEKGHEFEVTFQLMDQSGNRSEVTHPIAFTSPENTSKTE